jgi:hypothetical protein
MSKNEPAQRCPKCAERAYAELSAPSLNRGANPTTAVKIPENRSKREDLAVRMALEDTGHTDINTQQRAGDIAVKPLDMGVPTAAPSEIQTGFRNLDMDPKTRGAQIAALGAGEPAGYKRRNMALLGKLKG